MAKRALRTGDARTTDRTSARDRGTAVGTCGKRRRWTAEQKHKIVVEGMEQDVSAAMVAGRHGISTGQFYAWRQQLMLPGALDATANTVPNLAGIERIAVGPTNSVTPRRLAPGRIRYAASATGTVSTTPGGRQFQGSSCSSWWLLVLPETRPSSTSVR